MRHKEDSAGTATPWGCHGWPFLYFLYTVCHALKTGVASAVCIAEALTSRLEVKFFMALDDVWIRLNGRRAKKINCAVSHSRRCLVL